ncbi:hypothetical protein QCA50_006468 [Cerrena zonata]|uniref:Alcohol dehydrogenase-like N-terminal domain-containing protein n=1 Tax=Cerrena zonata TaxID=2478898 RepID=A0AAW0GJ89_9APHY
MRAVLIKDGKGPIDNLYIGETGKPTIKTDEVLVEVRPVLMILIFPKLTVYIKIKAFGLNRMDILQREGKYPLPPGASTILGVEFSGHVVDVGR